MLFSCFLKFGAMFSFKIWKWKWNQNSNEMMVVAVFMRQCWNIAWYNFLQMLLPIFERFQAFFHFRFFLFTSFNTKRRKQIPKNQLFAPLVRTASLLWFQKKTTNPSLHGDRTSFCTIEKKSFLFFKRPNLWKILSEFFQLSFSL